VGQWLARIVDDLIAAELGAGFVKSLVRVQIRFGSAGDGSGERGQCWDDDSDRGLNDHECRAAGLQPDAVVKSIGEAGVIDGHGAVRQVADDGAPIRIGMIMSVARIVVLAVRLSPGLFLRAALCVALRAHIRWIETGNKECGKQEARRSHGSSPLPGDGIDRIRARPLVIRTMR